MNQFFIRLYKGTYVSLFIISLLCGFSVETQAQIAVTVTGNTSTTPNLLTSYGTLASAITALNGITAISGPVTLSCTGTETAPVGGYSISFTAPTTAGHNITINGNSTSTVAASASLVSGTLTDAIFKLVGVSNITLENFTMHDNGNTGSSATTATTNTLTEWGVALLYNSTNSQGCQGNTISGNIISLNSSYLNAFGIYSNTNHTSTSITTLSGISSATGENNSNKVYSNTISNVNVPICFSGNSTYMDNSNDIGGPSLNKPIPVPIGVLAQRPALFIMLPVTRPVRLYQGPSGIFLMNQTGLNASWWGWGG